MLRDNVGNYDWKGRAGFASLDGFQATTRVPFSLDVHIFSSEWTSFDPELGTHRLAEFGMSELIWLTLLAITVFLILLIS